MLPTCYSVLRVDRGCWCGKADCIDVSFIDIRVYAKRNLRNVPAAVHGDFSKRFQPVKPRTANLFQE